MKTILFILCALILFSAEAKERLIYVARHCQATGKGKNILRPFRSEAGITQLGVQQSKWLGQRLKALKFKGKIYASPYYRTVATASYAASQCGLKVYPDARVQQRCHSDKGNMKKSATLKQLKKLFPNEIAQDAKLADDWLYRKDEPKGTPAHRIRMAKALDEILAENPDGNIMIVSHAGAVGALAAEMQDRCKEKIRGGTWNCALYKYKVDDNGKFHFLGYDISFLPAEAVTSNMHKIDPKKNPKQQKVKSGVDYKYEL